MLLGEPSFLILSFLLLFVSIAINNNTTLHLLLTAELLWITLFGLALILGLTADNLNLLSLTFFFLVLSAIEFGTGLILMLIQNTLTRTTNLTDSIFNKPKFLNRFKTSVYLNKLRWKL